MIARKFVHTALSAIAEGTVEMIDAEGTSTFGSGAMRATIAVHNPAFYAKLLRGASLAAGTSYMDGDWDSDDLVALVRVMARNQEALDGLGSVAAVPMRLYDSLGHAFRRNSRTGSRRNIEAHYDLGDDLFGLFLDKRMMYSSAVFETGKETLDEASDAKLMRLCRKLDLKSSDHLLEIGTGWGGLAVFAAEHFGCRVTTTTISKAQHAHAKRQVAAAGLSDRVEVLYADYRSLSGQYDKLVSVEMVEAVGHQYLDTYFHTCARLLRPDGLMALQAITIQDAAYRRALKSVDFIKKYIFPGGFIPCNSVLTASAGAAGLTLANLEDFGQDYARTLRVWRERLEQNRSQAIALGYDERFLRMWRFYFAYCEGGFMERSISDVQMLLTMPDYTGQVWRAHASSS